MTLRAVAFGLFISVAVGVLAVAGAYHSKLMASATDKMRPLLADVEIAEPRLPFYQNYAGQRVQDPEAIREGLLLQVESSVRWEQCVRALAADGAVRALEVGPGSVLQGLARKTVDVLAVQPVGTPEALEAVLDNL